MKKQLFAAVFGAALALAAEPAAEWKMSSAEAAGAWKTAGAAAKFENNALIVTPAAKEIMISSPRMSVPAEDNTRITFRLRAKGAAGDQRVARLYYSTDKADALDESRKLYSAVRFTGDWQLVTFDAEHSKQWQGNVTGFRADLTVDPGVPLEIESVKIHPPVDFVSAWHFGDAKTKAWSYSANLKQPARLADGAMRLEFTRPYSMGPMIPVRLDAAKCRFLTIRARGSKTGRCFITCYFATKDSPNLDENKKIVYPMDLTTGWNEITIPIHKWASWKGKVTMLRIDLSAPGTPYTMEISDVVFAQAQNLSGIHNTGRRLGPWRGLTPGVEYDLSFTLPAAGECVLEQRDFRHQVTARQLLAGAAGRNALRFRVTPTTTESVFFCKNDLSASEVSLKPAPLKTPVTWRASWIVDKEKRFARAMQFFQCIVTLPSAPVDCRFQGTADDWMNIWVNGKLLPLEMRPWNFTKSADVTEFFHEGENLISIRVFNNGEASGLLCNWVLDCLDGSRVVVDSGDAFRVVKSAAAGWMNHAAAPENTEPPLVLGAYNIPPWGAWGMLDYNPCLKRSQLKLDECRFTDLSGGTVVSGKVTALNLTAPVKTLQADVMAQNVKMGTAHITLDRELNNPGDTARFKGSVMGGLLQKGVYTLVFSSQALHVAGGVQKFSVAENPAKEPNIKAAVRPLNGTPTIFIDGKPLDSIIYSARLDNTGMDLMDNFYKRGIRLFNFGAGTGIGKGITTKAWGENGDDYTETLHKLNAFAARFPDAKVFITFGVDAPLWWVEKHPQECVWLEGRKQHQYVSSPASKVWKRDAAAWVKRFITAMEASPYANRIIGYRIASLCDGGEWQYPGTWGGYDRADFSEAAKVYFREFLKKRYKDDAALQKAWGKSDVTLDTAVVPPGAERTRNSGSLLRPAADRWAMDWIECQSEIIADAAINVLSAAREVLPDKLLGIYGGYLAFYNGYQLQNCGHLAFRRIYESGLANFYCGPTDYVLRNVGGPGGNMAATESVKLHNAVYIQENDTRTYLDIPSDHRHVSNLHESVGVLLRDLGIGLIEALPIYPAEISGNSFSNEGLLDAIGLMQKLYTINKGDPGSRRPEVAVLYSIESVPHLVESSGVLTSQTSTELRRNLSLAGMPHDVYLLEDLVKPGLPDYKVYVVANCFKPSAPVQAALAQLAKRRCVICAPADLSGKVPAEPAARTPEAWRELLVKAGVHCYTTGGDSVRDNGRFLMIHAASDGKKTITLPDRRYVVDVIAKKIVAKNDNSFVVNMQRGETGIFFCGTKQECENFIKELK